jgi:hypothetical protein
MLNDGADCIINKVICALKEAFSPTSSQPPIGGGTERVRVFAGEAAPLSAVDMHLDECGCGNDPFVWVRLVRRYRTQSFPQPYVGDAACGAPIAIAVEVGIARCAVVFTEGGCDWTAYESEAEVSLDDSARIELALCRAASLMKASNCSDAVALDAVVPFGPEGGVIAWVGTLYARVDN